MSVPRANHTATLLATGQVLVIGGIPQVPAVYVGYAPTSSAEIYDPASNAFALAGNMADGRFWHSATLLSDGRVLVVGGGHSDAPLCCSGFRSHRRNLSLRSRGSSRRKRSESSRPTAVLQSCLQVLVNGLIGIWLFADLSGRTQTPNVDVLARIQKPSEEVAQGDHGVSACARAGLTWPAY